MNNMQIVDFDMSRFEHPDKGPWNLLSRSLQVAQQVNRRCPSRLQHPARETDMKIQDRTGWAAILCKAIHAGAKDQIREDEDKTVAYLLRGERVLRWRPQTKKLEKKKVAEARREATRRFEAMGVYN